MNLTKNVGSLHYSNYFRCFSIYSFYGSSNLRIVFLQSGNKMASKDGGSNDVAPSDGTFISESNRKMVYPRVFSTPVIHNDNVYVIGGCDQMGQPVDSFECYDHGKKKWNMLASMPTKRAAPACGVVGDKIVAVGGVGDVQQPVNAVEVYDITEKKWKQLEDLPEGLLGVSAVVKGKSYSVRVCEFEPAHEIIVLTT